MIDESPTMLIMPMQSVTEVHVKCNDRNDLMLTNLLRYPKVRGSIDRSAAWLSGAEGLGFFYRVSTILVKSTNLM